MKTLLIVNPNSANGKTASEWPAIEQALEHTLGSFDTQFTEVQHDATRITRAALKSGVERILCIGGDGTNNEVVNGFFDDQQAINPEARLGFIPRGTGGDLRKSLGIKPKLADCLPVLAANNCRPVDVGRTSLTNPEGQLVMRHFINITSFGIGGLVDKRVDQSTKALGGKASFFIGTIKAMFEYRNKDIHLKVDDVFDETIRAYNIAVANGQYFGGGMWVAPEASLDDGLFDVIVMGDLSTMEMVTKGHRVYKGTHLELPKVQALRGKHIEATCEDEVLIDMDGEQPGRLPISLDILPKAIRLIVP